MTATLATARVGPTSEPSVRPLGLLCLWAGVLGAASGVLLAVIHPAVEDDRYSYPLSASGFAVIQIWFVVQHLGLVAGLVALGRSGAAGGHRLGLRVAIAGMVLLTIVELLAITAARSPYPDGLRTGLLDAGYGIASIAVGAGLAAAGVAVARLRRWRGWQRWLPLTTGIYVFVPMFPLMFSGFLAARLAITGWMLLFALLGWVLARTAAR